MAALAAALAWAPPLARAEAASSPDALSAAERRALPGRIAFVSERDGSREVYLIRPTGEEERRLTHAPTGAYPGAVTKDGSALLIVSVEERAGLHLEQLWLQPLDGARARAIGPRAGHARNPSWSPDGRWFAFESDSESFADVFRIDRDGSGLKRLTSNPQGNFEPAVSPDGAQIAFVSSRDGDPEVYRMRSDGSRPQRLTAFQREDWAPRWSPDGRWLAFLSNREGVDRIFLMEANGTHLRALTGPRPGASKDKSAAPAEGAHAWSPDGTRVAYVTRGEGSKARIWIANLRTGAQKALTEGEHTDERPEWSPDGRYLAFDSNRTGQVELFLMRADGTGQTQLTRSAGADWLPRWVPAGGRRPP